MKNKHSVILVMFAVLLATTVFAQGTQQFEKAKALIDEKTPCASLSEPQLALIGDYFMEQMHPGQSHESMDAMMDGEGSEQLQQMHVDIARTMYCGEKGSIQKMMGCMMHRGMGRMMNVMGGTMMPGTMMGGSSMMGTTFFWPLGTILGTAFMLGLVLLVWFAVIKLFKELFNKK